MDDPGASFLPWSKPVVSATYAADATLKHGQFGTLDFRLFFTNGYPSSASSNLSPWHDIPLLATAGGGVLFNFVTEIPMYQTAKMEVSKSLPENPIAQDSKNGAPRYYKYGTPFFNYGLLPQTWEDPASCKPSSVVGGSGQQECGDDDPLDVIEVGEGPLLMGSVTPVKVSKVGRGNQKKKSFSFFSCFLQEKKSAPYLYLYQRPY